MAYKNDNTDWLAKEARECCRTILNTQIMRLPEDKLPDIDKITKVAKQLTDFVFNSYPDNEPNKGEKIEDII